MKLPLICPPGPCKRLGLGLGADGPAPSPCPCPFAHQETRSISQIRYSCVKGIHSGKGGSTNKLIRLYLCDGRGVSRQWCLHKRAGFELSRQRVKCNFGIHGWEGHTTSTVMTGIRCCTAVHIGWRCTYRCVYFWASRSLVLLCYALVGMDCVSVCRRSRESFVT